MADTAGYQFVVQRCWVSKCLSQLSLHWSLGRQVKFLEELWGDGDAARGLNLLKSGIGIMGAIKMLMVVVAVGVGLVWLETMAVMATIYLLTAVPCRREVFL